MTEVRKPCPSCPWLLKANAGEIPGFSLELAEGLADACPKGGYGPDLNAPMFGCHKSRPGEEIACAGWLAVCGSSHPNVRIMVVMGKLPAEALRPLEGLHSTYDEMIAKLRGQVTMTWGRTKWACGECGASGEDVGAPDRCPECGARDATTTDPVDVEAILRNAASQDPPSVV